VQIWLECNYIQIETYKELYKKYDQILGKLVNMSLKPENWKY